MATGHQHQVSLEGTFTIASQENVWLEMYTETAMTRGLGYEVNLDGYEFYTKLELWKLT